MTFHRRLPHLYETDQPVFLTWRLHDSLPSHRVFPRDTLSSGRAFAAMDRLLDEACGGALATPAVALSKLTKSLKGITAKRANAILTLTGSLFWQEARLRVLGKSYDHLVRHEGEFEKIQNYIWSGWATGGSPADQGVRPTAPVL